MLLLAGCEAKAWCFLTYDEYIDTGKIKGNN